MVKAIAYKLQENAFAGLQPATRRLLNKLAEEAKSASSRKSAKVTARRTVAAGSVLLREWHGVSHRVTVLDDGVVFNHQRYRSLSAVAREITGTRWSGPLFFGLRSGPRGDDDGRG